LTYIEMMRTTAETLGKRRFFVPVGLFSPKFSRLWVRLVTGAPKQLIGPLVESLRHPMIARNDDLMRRYGIEPSSFKSSLQVALSNQIRTSKATDRSSKGANASTRLNRPGTVNTVCSVQRLPLPEGRDAAWVASKYASWLIQFLYPLIRVERAESGSLRLMLGLGFKRFSICLLQLNYAAERSSSHRQLFYIQGGILLSSSATPKGRFEFREVLAGQYVMAAIFDFIPALPWWIYKSTQALLHLFVMWAFKVELMRQHSPRRDEESSPSLGEGKTSRINS
jgi:hypothetical protein